MNVPTYQGRQVGTEVVRQPRYGAESFGAYGAQQISKLGEVGQKLGQEISTTKARETINSLLPQLDQDFGKLQEAYQGSNATPEAFTAFDESYQKRVEDATKDLSPYARDLVMSDVGSRKATYATAWGRYSTTQIKDARDKSLDAENERIAQELSIGKTSDEAGIDNSLLIKQNFKARYPGQSDEFYNQQTNKMIGKASFIRASTLSNINPLQAQEYIKANKEIIYSFEPARAAVLERNIAKAAQTQFVDEKANAYFSMGRSQEDVLAAIAQDKELQGDISAEVTDKVMDMFTRQEKIDQKTVGATIAEQINLAVANPQGYKAPRNGLVTPAAAEALDGYKTASLNETGDEGVFYALRSRIASDDWRNVYLQDYKGSLSGSQYKELLGLYAGRYQGRNLEPDDLTQVETVQSVLKDSTALVIGDMPSTNTEQKLVIANKEERFLSAVGKQISYLERSESARKGKPYKVSPDEARKIARRLALDWDNQKESKPGYYDINTQNLLMLGLEPDVGKYKQQLKEELKAKGGPDSFRSPITDKFLTDYFNLKISQRQFTSNAASQ